MSLLSSLCAGLRRCRWALLGLLTTLAACETVAESDRFIDMPTTEVQRAVLLEDFTGQACLNCPRAHRVIDSLTARYGSDKIIAVSIHGGALALMADRHPQGLGTALGNAYMTKWGVQWWPAGRVNRQGEIVTDKHWADALNTALQTPSTLRLDLSNAADSTTQQLHAAVTLTHTTPAHTAQMASAESTLRGHLQIWLVEDSITAVQKLENGSYAPKYLHRHVLREALNGTWGTEVTLAAGQMLTQHFDLTYTQVRRHAQLSLVAFVYTDEGVQQVVSAPLRFGAKP